MTSVAALMNMRGRHALITGAAGRLGGVFAETLAEMGANLTLTDRPDRSCDPLATRLRERWQVEVTIVDCDLERPEERQQLVSSVRGGSPLDVLINNAAFVGSDGLTGWVTSFEQQTIETWRRSLEVNLTAAFELSQALTPMLRESGRGSIVNIASIYGLVGPDMQVYEGTALGNPAAYAASKGGLVQLTRWLSTVLAPAIRVNAMVPGGILRGQPQQFIARYESRTPLRRMAVEDDFRGAIAYLASDASSYVTGQVLCVDGGWTAW